MQADQGGKRLGWWLAECRDRHDLTQSQMAARIGVAPRSYQELEAGRVDRPRTTTITVIEQTLGLEPGSVRRIMAGDSVPYPDPQPVENGNHVGARVSQLEADLATVRAQVDTLISLLRTERAGGRG